MNQNFKRNMYTARFHFFSDQLNETDQHISYMMQGLLIQTVFKVIFTSSDVVFHFF